MVHALFCLERVMRGYLEKGLGAVQGVRPTQVGRVFWRGWQVWRCPPAAPAGGPAPQGPGWFGLANRALEPGVLSWPRPRLRATCTPAIGPAAYPGLVGNGCPNQKSRTRDGLWGGAPRGPDAGVLGPSGRPVLRRGSPRASRSRVRAPNLRSHRRRSLATFAGRCRHSLPVCSFKS